MKLLTQSAFWAVPGQGPLVILWSLATTDSPATDNDRSLVTTKTFDHCHGLVSRAIAAFEAVTNVDIVEVDDSHHSIGMMRVGTFKSRGLIKGCASGNVQGGHESVVTDATLNTYIHEIGDFMGLAHPFVDMFRKNFFLKGSNERSTSNSIMTYGPTSTLTQNNINMLQFLYGAPETDNHGLISLLDTPAEYLL